jgi:hypothetical protein
MKYLSAIAIGTCLLLTSAAAVYAAANPPAPNPNRPSFTCGTTGAMGSPGNAASSPGSPFNEPSGTSAGGKAGMVYAGGPLSNSAANPNAFSGYDVACHQVP